MRARNKHPSLSENGQGRLGTLVLGCGIWVLPILWIGLSLSPRAPISATSRTVTTLTATKSTLNAFRKANKRLPLDLGEALAWARAHDHPMYRFDALGNRLAYTRLSATHYVLRSFGRDERQARFHGNADFAALNFRPADTTALSYRYSSIPSMDMYPAALLAGAEAPGRKWRAEVFLDHETGARTLFVFGRSSPAKIMLAPHDRVEEFLWLPDGLRIIFTATGSSRYGDGVFLWNLIDDSVENLWRTVMASGLPTPTRSEEKLWLSLAGINVNGPTAYIYAKPSTPGGVLNPADFFNKSNLTAVRLPEGEKRPRLVSPQRLSALDLPPFLKPLDLTAQVDMTAMTPVQAKWLELSLHGEAEKVLVRWQDFSETQAGTILFPYCLWYLSSIYAESFNLMIQAESRDSEVLRSYGAEIAQGLMDYRVGPSYLRALGRYTYMKLLAGEPLPYQFAHLRGHEEPLPELPDHPEMTRERSSE